MDPAGQSRGGCGLSSTCAWDCKCPLHVSSWGTPTVHCDEGIAGRIGHGQADCPQIFRLWILLKEGRKSHSFRQWRALMRRMLLGTNFNPWKRNDSLEMDEADTERRTGKYTAIAWACELIRERMKQIEESSSKKKKIVALEHHEEDGSQKVNPRTQV